MRQPIVKSASTAILLAYGCASAPAPEIQRPAPDVRTTGTPNAATSCNVGRPAALTNGAITIRPGETLCVELQSRGDSVVPVELLESASPDALVLTLKQDQASQGATLTLQNPFPVLLSYQAAIRIPSRSDTHHTSTCPVLSHRLGIEMWPQQIEEVTLSGFKRVPEGATLVCK